MPLFSDKVSLAVSVEFDSVFQKENSALMMFRAKRLKKTPARLTIPLSPTFTPDAKEITGARAEITHDMIGQALTNRNRISKSYHQRYKNGDPGAIRELLQLNPAFINEGWVRGALSNPFIAEKLLKGKGGRRKWDSQVDGVILVALVDHICKDKEVSREKAFKKLEAPLPLSFDRIKALYYETKGNRRLAPLLFIDEKWEVVTAEQFREDISKTRCRARLLIWPRG